MKSNLSIVIPIYNEEKNLGITIPEIIDFCKTNNYKLILVNDGSKDNSKTILKNYENLENIKIYHHKLNKGYGAAIKTGISVCDTKYIITIDADGQHYLEDVEKLYLKILETDADMIIGSRKGSKSSSLSRGIGKTIIRTVAKMLMKVPVYDINSGMKIYNTELAKNYLSLTPNTMSYSDIIALIFINNQHLVIEEPIKIKERLAGKSTISIETAFQTLMEIINIVILFNPLKIFIPLSIISIIASLIHGIPILIAGRGLSVGSLLGLVAGILFFLLGLIAEQLSWLRKSSAKNL
ncbi:MAG: glycosyltransferase family 2 protein [Bacteroidales bacterium]|jgi:glycosyltransferase involved in cell wall biosynthesis|nr:glycosyltransferase family 2 protein [Bacteroidales bacterium]MDY0314887.1 glycosyltransferase family 2 protein [Bacteroidales bacterium]NLB86304.1 glycosyltransferase family 2 protein [Bacteroidales bacterium]